MVQKINGIISMTGEKLHERQFLEAVQHAQAEMNLTVNFFVGFADLQDSVYHFYYEFAEQELTRQQIKDFTLLVDNKLKDLNIEYQAKRESHRIKHPHTHLLQENSFQKFKEMSVAQGARDAQFKLNRLMQDEKRHAMFKELIKK